MSLRLPRRARRRSCRRATPGSSPSRAASARWRATRAGIDVALVGAAPHGRDVAAHPRCPASRAGATISSNAASVSAIVLFTFFLLCVSLALRKTAISRSPARARAPARARWGTSALKVTPGGRLHACRATSSASASWGIHLGETKLVISMRARPAATSASMSRRLPSSGDERRLVLQAVAQGRPRRRRRDRVTWAKRSVGGALPGRGRPAAMGAGSSGRVRAGLRQHPRDMGPALPSGKRVPSPTSRLGVARGPRWYIRARMPPHTPGGAPARPHGRYAIYDEIASGGMATVHLGRLLGRAGFSRTVAIKRLHPQFAKDPEFVAMFLDEARLAARIRHPNVVADARRRRQRAASSSSSWSTSTASRSARLIRAAVRKRRDASRRASSPPILARRAPRAARRARGARRARRAARHRPPRRLAAEHPRRRRRRRARARLRHRQGRRAACSTTRDGQLKGKLAYMAPEQLHGEALDRRADVYAAGVVLWEALVAARLFAGKPQIAGLRAAPRHPAVDPPSTRCPRLPPRTTRRALRALRREAEARFPTALDMAEALEASSRRAPRRGRRLGHGRRRRAPRRARRAHRRHRVAPDHQHPRLPPPHRRERPRITRLEWTPSPRRSPAPAYQGGPASFRYPTSRPRGIPALRPRRRLPPAPSDVPPVDRPAARPRPPPPPSPSTPHASAVGRSRCPSAAPPPSGSASPPSEPSPSPPPSSSSPPSPPPGALPARPRPTRSWPAPPPPAAPEPAPGLAAPSPARPSPRRARRPPAVGGHDDLRPRTVPGAPPAPAPRPAGDTCSPPFTHRCRGPQALQARVSPVKSPRARSLPRPRRRARAGHRSRAPGSADRRPRSAADTTDACIRPPTRGRSSAIRASSSPPAPASSPAARTLPAPGPHRLRRLARRRRQAAPPPSSSARTIPKATTPPTSRSPSTAPRSAHPSRRAPSPSIPATPLPLRAPRQPPVEENVILREGDSAAPSPRASTPPPSRRRRPRPPAPAPTRAVLTAIIALLRHRGGRRASSPTSGRPPSAPPTTSAPPARRAAGSRRRRHPHPPIVANVALGIGIAPPRPG